MSEGLDEEGESDCGLEEEGDEEGRLEEGAEPAVDAVSLPEQAVKRAQRSTASKTAVIFLIFSPPNYI